MTTLRPWEALLCVLVALTGLLVMGPLLVSRLGLGGIILSELLLVGLPPLAFAQARGASLALELPSARLIIGGILAGAGACWLVALFEATLLERILPVPPAVRESLTRLASPNAPLVLDLLALALTPALCEEALFRGLTLPALRPRLGAAGAVIVSALLFGLFHLSIYRLIPTALLGVALGIARVRSGSLWPALIFHAVNNALVLVMMRAGLDAPPLPTHAAGIVAVIAAFIAVIAGFSLLRPPGAQRA